MQAWLRDRLLCFANRQIAVCTRLLTHPVLCDTSLLGHGVSLPNRPTWQEIPVVRCTLQTSVAAYDLTPIVTEQFRLRAPPACVAGLVRQAPAVKTTLHREGDTNVQGSSG